MKLGDEEFKFGELMWWTAFVKKASYVALALGCLGSLILAFTKMQGYDASPIMAVLVFLGGVGASFTGVAGIMMICEISQNIYELNINAQEIKSKLSYSNGGSTGNLSNTAKSYLTPSAPPPPGESWKCPNCGRTNSKTDMFCKECGTSK